MGAILTPTMARAPGPPSSLRMKLLLVLLAAGIYAAAPPAYLLFRARVAALRDIWPFPQTTKSEPSRGISTR